MTTVGDQCQTQLSLNLLDVCLTVDVPVDTGGVGRDVEVRPEEKEHARSVEGSLVHNRDGNTTVVRLPQRVSVVDLQHNVVLLLQLEPHITRQLRRLGVFSPGEHDLAAV